MERYRRFAVVLFIPLIITTSGFKLHGNADVPSTAAPLPCWYDVGGSTWIDYWASREFGFYSWTEVDYEYGCWTYEMGAGGDLAWSVTDSTGVNVLRSGIEHYWMPMSASASGSYHFEIPGYTGMAFVSAISTHMSNVVPWTAETEYSRWLAVPGY